MRNGVKGHAWSGQLVSLGWCGDLSVSQHLLFIPSIKGSVGCAAVLVLAKDVLPIIELLPLNDYIILCKQIVTGGHLLCVAVSIQCILILILVSQDHIIVQSSYILHMSPIIK